jgi:hypothetical protein
MSGVWWSSWVGVFKDRTPDKKDAGKAEKRHD